MKKDTWRRELLRFVLFPLLIVLILLYTKVNGIRLGTVLRILIPALRAGIF